MVQGNTGGSEEKHDGEAHHAQVEMEKARRAGNDAAQVSVPVDCVSACGSQALPLPTRSLQERRIVVACH